MIPPMVPLEYNKDEGPRTTSICCKSFTSTSFKWSEPSPETSLTNLPLDRILTLVPPIPLMIGCPTPGPKPDEFTPSK